MRVLVVGGSGFVGQPLVEALTERGDDVCVAGRSAPRVKKAFGDAVTPVEWDPNPGPPPPGALEGVDGVVNLAGEPVAKGRWSRAKKRRIRASRVDGTRHLVEGIAAAASRPKVLVSASAIGWYGDRKHNTLHEDAPPGGDFLAGVCVAWEAEAARARALGVRTAIVRMGVVLGKGGGAYPMMTGPVRMFLGGTIGLGRAWTSWIHIDDVVGILLHCLDSEDAVGVYNATAPNPVSNRDLMATFGSVLRRPIWLAIPPVALHARFGGFASVVTSSQRVIPLRTLGIGHVFKFPTIREAVEDLR